MLRAVNCVTGAAKAPPANAKAVANNSDDFV
jgi:hypothetical protein